VAAVTQPVDPYEPDVEDGALLTYAEAAALAAVDASTVRQWVSRQQLPALLVDGRKLVPERLLLDCERDRRRSRRRSRVGRGAPSPDVSH
jgi:excisionase family DNA binding protein